MPQGIWASSNLQQNAVLQGGPVYIRSMQADGTSLFIPQNAPQQAMQQHNRKLIKPHNSYILKNNDPALSCCHGSGTDCPNATRDTATNAAETNPPGATSQHSA